MACTRRALAANDPVRKYAHAPAPTTRQSSTPSASWNCRGSIGSFTRCDSVMLLLLRWHYLVRFFLATVRQRRISAVVRPFAGLSPVRDVPHWRDQRHEARVAVQRPQRGMKEDVV